MAIIRSADPNVLGNSGLFRGILSGFRGVISNVNTGLMSKRFEAMINLSSYKHLQTQNKKLFKFVRFATQEIPAID